MRGIPRHIATREDVWNVAMDLPPARVRLWLAGLDTDTLRRVGMTAEEYQILCSRVAEARQIDIERDDRAARLRRELADATRHMRERRCAADLSMLKHRQDQRDLEAARLAVAAIAHALEVHHG